MALRHKRDTDARRTSRAALVAAPLAVLATASAVTVGVLVGSPEADAPLAEQAAAAAPTASAHAHARSRDVVSRSSSRMSARLERHMDRNAQRVAKRAAEAAEQAATLHAVRRAHVKRWTTTLLNLWTGPAKDATRVGLLAAGEHVLVTGRHDAGRVELALDGHSRWVTAGYLAAQKPKPEPEPETTSGSSSSSSSSARTAAPAGLSSAPCPDSSVENGLTSGAVRVYRAVCHAFPQITSYGGWDAHGEHVSGKALDIMTSDKGLGDAIAAYLQAHAGELGLYDIIWWDRIWTPVRASEGWRSYGDHGSATANHMDHVHVAVS